MVTSEAKRRRASAGGTSGLGTFPILFGYISYRIRILMYLACILKDTRILMYPDVSQTYLTCSVIFEEKTCVLTFCMYFDMYPKGVQDIFGIHVRYIRGPRGGECA